MTKVCELMTREVVTIEANKTALEAAKLMTETERECLVVVDRGKPVGILTERDFVRRIVVNNRDPAQARVSEFMSEPLIMVGPDVRINEAARLMMENNVRRLPVVKDDKLLGIITSTDYVRHLSSGFTDYYKVIMRFI
ncbi:MAG: cyclic nucleotide-binding/CBS domain-containing protein [Candidatus Bathyarchaeia archaeon]